MSHITKAPVIDNEAEEDFIEELLSINPDDLIKVDKSAELRKALLANPGPHKVGDRIGDFVVLSMAEMASKYCHHICPDCHKLNAYEIAAADEDAVHVCGWCEGEF